MQWQGRDAVLLHADSMRRFRVDPMTVNLLCALDGWTSADDLVATGLPASGEELETLADLGVIDKDVVASEGDGPAENYWSVLDLAVHRQSNAGGYRAADVRARGTPPPPAFKPRSAGATTALPSATNLPGSLQDVLEQRRSVRTYASRPMRLTELSALLYHSGRVRGSARDDHLGEVVSRPFAAGGGRSELELYVVANDVEGLASGAHYYDAQRHELVLVTPSDDYQERLNRVVHAATAGMLNRDPPAVVLVTAVFARVMWKYEGIALTTIHKNTGCLFQTLYLVATALELAPCAVGGGEEAATARWLGLDPLVESQVGCFLVGPRHP